MMPGCCTVPYRVSYRTGYRTLTGTFTGTGTGTGRSLQNITESRHNAVSWGINYLLVKVTYHHHRLAYDLLCSKLRCIGQVAVMIDDLYE